MPIFSKKDAAASFPVDAAAPFQPTKTIFVKEGTEFALAVTMTDVTAAVAALLTRLDPNPDPLLTAAKSAAASGSLPVTLQLTRANRFVRTWTATQPALNTTANDDNEAGGGEVTVAELANPLWSLGRWTLRFPSGSAHSDHDVELRPAGFAARADEFVKDSVPFFWDVLDGHRLCKLYRAADGKKVEIARFVAESTHARDGVLLLVNEARGGVDEVVAMLTLMGVLNRSESFRA